MKASLKFREDQRPLARAKIPISILGLPFLAGAVAGDPHDLRLELTTSFESGPAFRFSYRPNESFNPFILAVKTGIGAFGSPVASPLSMITEFNLFSSHGGSGSPVFSVVFKPRLGDFSFRKSASSKTTWRKVVSLPDREEMFPHPPLSASTVNGCHDDGKSSGIVVDVPETKGGIEGLISGISIMTKSLLPIRRCAIIGFRWGFKLPAEIQSSLSACTFTMNNLPMLVMNKISIKHLPATTASVNALHDYGANVTANEVIEACKSVKQEFIELQSESAALRKAVEDFRGKLDGRSFATEMIVPGNKDSFGSEAGNGGIRASQPSKKEKLKEVKTAHEDVSREELKKALMNASISTRGK